ncbi:MAG: hypothetical protein ACR2QC_09610 [Gammaproteobacteria bacterium]
MAALYRNLARKKTAIPAKAGIFFARSANGGFALQRMEIPAFAGMAAWVYFGRRRRKRADSPRKPARSHLPIPAKAGISAAAKRRVIVQLPPSAYRFLPSQEWDGRGMGQRGRRDILRLRRRFLLSQEWDVGMRRAVCVYNG